MNNLTISKQDLGDAIQFLATAEGINDEAVLDLKRMDDDLYTATHTGVPKSMGGKGVGKSLVKAMIEDARLHQYKVIPACSFVEAQFNRHKEWADLKA